MISDIAKYGAKGVQLFYVLSGFLTAKSLQYYDKEKICEWYKKKIVRLMPMYWGFTTLNLIIFPEGNVYWLGSVKKLSLFNILVNYMALCHII